MLNSTDISTLSPRDFFEKLLADHLPWLVHSEQLDLFDRFMEVFMAYNAHTNLSAIREPLAIVEKHFVDSLMLARFEGEGLKNATILDIGTGGGFPGIPLAIVSPESYVVLLDSTGKKIRACNEFVQALGLSVRVTAYQGRAEELLHLPNGAIHAGAYDFVVSRATAAMPDILGWAAPFMRPDGAIFLYKTPSQEEHIAGLQIARRLSLKLANTYRYSLAGQDRSILKFIRA
jgi:16S rRNA (guanine527-N7)-methyltransferase